MSKNHRLSDGSISLEPSMRIHSHQIAGVGLNHEPCPLRQNHVIINSVYEYLVILCHRIIKMASPIRIKHTDIAVAWIFGKMNCCHELLESLYRCLPIPGLQCRHFLSATLERSETQALGYQRWQQDVSFTSQNVREIMDTRYFLLEREVGEISRYHSSKQADSDL
jgi:hypothetical protein